MFLQKNMNHKLQNFHVSHDSIAKEKKERNIIFVEHQIRNEFINLILTRRSVQNNKTQRVQVKVKTTQTFKVCF